TFDLECEGDTPGSTRAASYTLHTKRYGDRAAHREGLPRRAQGHGGIAALAGAAASVGVEQDGDAATDYAVARACSLQRQRDLAVVEVVIHPPRSEPEGDRAGSKAAGKGARHGERELGVDDRVSTQEERGVDHQGAGVLVDAGVDEHRAIEIGQLHVVADDAALPKNVEAGALDVGRGRGEQLPAFDDLPEAVRAIEAVVDVDVTGALVEIVQAGDDARRDNRHAE